MEVKKIAKMREGEPKLNAVKIGYDSVDDDYNFVVTDNAYWFLDVKDKNVLIVGGKAGALPLTVLRNDPKNVYVIESGFKNVKRILRNVIGNKDPHHLRGGKDDIILRGVLVGDGTDVRGEYFGAEFIPSGTSSVVKHTSKIDDYSYHDINIIVIRQEGMEMRILNGARNVISSERPEIVITKNMDKNSIKTVGFEFANEVLDLLHEIIGDDKEIKAQYMPYEKYDMVSFVFILPTKDIKGEN